jgi:CheY-like chemotaxis protein
MGGPCTPLSAGWRLLPIDRQGAMPREIRVLIVEDSQADAGLAVRELKRGGFDPTFKRVETADAMAAALDNGQWDLILSDYSMPDFSAPAAFKVVLERRLDIPFIIVSGTVGEEFLGRPGQECWAEIWDIIGPMMDQVIETGEATWSEDLFLLMLRYGYLEETYFTFSYSPIRDEAGRPSGITN